MTAQSSNICIIDNIFRMEMPTSVRVVALYLVFKRDGKSGQCNPSHARIASACDISKDTVKRAIKWLTAEGVIDKIKCPLGFKSWQYDFKAWIYGGLVCTDAPLEGALMHPTRMTLEELYTDEQYLE